MRQMYIVHPTFWSKAAMWFFTTFTMSSASSSNTRITSALTHITASGIKEKIINIESVYNLFTAINRDQIKIPEFVLQYDLQVRPSAAA